GRDDRRAGGVAPVHGRGRGDRGAMSSPLPSRGRGVAGAYHVTEDSTNRSGGTVAYRRRGVGRDNSLSQSEGWPSPAYGGGLENRYRCKPIGGSNPSPSALVMSQVLADRCLTCWRTSLSKQEE